MLLLLLLKMRGLGKEQVEPGLSSSMMTNRRGLVKDTPQRDLTTLIC